MGKIMRCLTGAILIALCSGWPADGLAEDPLVSIKTVNSSNGPVPPYVVHNVNIDNDKEEISIEGATVNLVVAQTSTIQDDLHIRITDDGWAFLALVLKINLIGAIPKSEVDAGRGAQAAYGTLAALLNDEVIGTQVAFDIFELPDALGYGYIDGCLLLYPRKRNCAGTPGSGASTDAGGYPGQPTVCRCLCDDDADPTVSPKTPDLNWGGQNWDACQNCLAGHVGNLFHLPTGPFWIKDPYDQLGSAGTPKQYYVGPFFKETLKFELWNSTYMDTSGSYSDGVPANEATLHNLFTGADCRVDSNGNYPNANCYPKSPKIGIDLKAADYDASNLTNEDGLPAIVIQLNLYELAAHGKLTLDFTSKGDCTDWVVCPTARAIIDGILPVTVDDNEQGLMYQNANQYLHAKLYARMIDGYWTAAGSEGAEVAAGGSGGGGGSPSALNCSSPPSAAASCSSANDCPIGFGCTAGECVLVSAINAEANNARLLGLFAVLDSDSGKGGSCTWNSDFGVCATEDLNIEVTLFSGIFAFLNDLVESIAEPMVTDIVIEKLGSTLSNKIGGLLEDSVGLPIDFNQLFTGGPFTKKELCGLRDGQTTTPACTADGTTPPGTHPNGGRTGTCACDNQDLALGATNGGDMELNYMDNNDAYNWGYGAGIFGGIVPGTATSWYDNQHASGGDYGVARFGGWTTLLGVETVDAPYDVGTYVTSKLSITGNKGQSLLLDMAMSPKTAAAPSGLWSNVSCFGGTVWTDPTGPDNTVATRRDAGSWAGPDAVLGTTDDWSDLDNTPTANQHLIAAFSQYSLEEVIYMLITSGSLCMSVTADSLGGGIGDFLKLSNMKMLMPGLDPVTATTPAQKALINANTTVGVLLRPSGTPTVRVLGSRNIASVGSAGEWPNGDCIPNDALNTHTNANLNLLDETNTIGAPCTAGIGSYDLMIALPHLQVEFYLLNGASATQVFEHDVDLVLTVAVEYTKTGPVTTVYSQGFSKYLEILVDVWLGCEGNLVVAGKDYGTQIGEQTGALNPDSNAYCMKADYNSNLGVNKAGITSLIGMLLSTRLSLLARTTFLLDGLTMEFNKVGAFGSDSDVASDAGTKAYQRFGDVTGDWLAIAATLAGNLDLGNLFDFLGGSPAPYMMEPETYLVPAASEDAAGVLGDPTAIKPGVQYNLTPAQSAEFGFREYGSAFDLFSSPAVSKLDYSSDEATMRFSYSLDGAPWTPYRSGGRLTFNYLPNGFHILEVRAKDKDDFTDSSPAAIAFYVDSIAPTVAIQDVHGELHYSTGKPIALERDGTVTVVLADNISASNAVRARWSTDGQKWHPLYNGTSNIYLPGDPSALRVLYVRAQDEFGNSTQQTFTLQAAPDEDGFGCNTTQGGQWGMLLMLMGLGLALRRPRMV